MDDDDDFILQMVSRVESGDLTITEALMQVAATTANAEHYDVTSQFHCALCALGAQHLVSQIRSVEAVMNRGSRLLGFGLKIDQGTVEDFSAGDQLSVNAAIKAIVEAGNGGRTVNMDMYEVNLHGDHISIGNRGIDPTQWDDVISEFRRSMDKALGDTPEPEPPSDDGGLGKWMNP